MLNSNQVPCDVDKLDTYKILLMINIRQKTKEFFISRRSTVLCQACRNIMTSILRRYMQASKGFYPDCHSPRRQSHHA